MNQDCEYQRGAGIPGNMVLASNRPKIHEDLTPDFTCCSVLRHPTCLSRASSRLLLHLQFLESWMLRLGCSLLRSGRMCELLLLLLLHRSAARFRHGAPPRSPEAPAILQSIPVSEPCLPSHPVTDDTASARLRTLWSRPVGWTDTVLG